MTRLAALACFCTIVITSCTQGSEPLDDGAPQKSTAASKLQRVVNDRIKTCLQTGATEQNCACRAAAASEIMRFEDFQEETRHLKSGDQRAMDDFQRRMFAENRNTMIRLSEALSKCPEMRIELE